MFTLVIGLIAACVIATYVRYGSLHPCDWLQKDMMAESDMPEIWVETRIRMRFFLDGITEPTARDCLEGWWTFRVEEIEALE